MGKQDIIHTVSLEPSEGAEDFRKKLEEVINKLDNFTIFADLSGGTPCNIASRLLLEGRQFDLYAGMNIPMVLTFLNNVLVDDDEDIIEAGTAGIIKINNLLKNSSDDEDDEL